MYKSGDRIKLVEMPNDPHPIPVGTKGTVESVCEIGAETILNMKWDNGRTLTVILPHDKVSKIRSDL